MTKTKYALESYRDGRYSPERAAAFSKIGIWDFFDLLRQKKVPLNYDKEELEEELKIIRWKSKR